jgi:hypothetical protein
MRSRNRHWSVIFLVVGLGLGSLATAAGCTSTAEPSGASKNFTLKGKAK